MTLELTDYQLDLLHDSIEEHKKQTTNDTKAEHLENLKQEIEKEIRS